MILVAITSRDEALLERFWRELNEVCGFAAFRDMKSLRDGLTMLNPSVVVVDPQTSNLKDRRSLRSLCRQYRHTPVVVVSSPADVQSELDFLRTGVRGLLNREADPSLYRPMLEAVLRGEMWFSRQAISLFLEEVGLVRLRSRAETSNSSLSEREMQVVRMAMTGASNKDIADSLHITVRTVKAHLSHIFAKLGITQRSELFSLEETLLSSSSAAIRPS